MSDGLSRKMYATLLPFCFLAQFVGLSVALPAGPPSDGTLSLDIAASNLTLNNSAAISLSDSSDYPHTYTSFLYDDLKLAYGFIHERTDTYPKTLADISSADLAYVSKEAIRKLDDDSNWHPDSNGRLNEQESNFKVTARNLRLSIHRPPPPVRWPYTRDQLGLFEAMLWDLMNDGRGAHEMRFRFSTKGSLGSKRILAEGTIEYLITPALTLNNSSAPSLSTDPDASILNSSSATSLSTDPDLPHSYTHRSTRRTLKVSYGYINRQPHLISGLPAPINGLDFQALFYETRRRREEKGVWHPDAKGRLNEEESNFKVIMPTNPHRLKLWIHHPPAPVRWPYTLQDIEDFVALLIKLFAEKGGPFELAFIFSDKGTLGNKRILAEGRLEYLRGGVICLSASCG